MSNKEKLRELIVKACPELASKYHVSTGNNLRCKNCGEPDTYDNRGTCTKGEISTPHLEHLMIAIEKSRDYTNFPTFIGIGSDGELLIDHDCNMGESDSSGIVLDLTKPTLDQSEEVISKLIEILK